MDPAEPLPPPPGAAVLPGAVVAKPAAKPKRARRTKLQIEHDREEMAAGPKAAPVRSRADILAGARAEKG